MLSDAQRAVLEPPVEACSPKAKTPPQDLQRAPGHPVAAPERGQRTGAKWRAIPDEPGPRRHAAQIFIGWARAGVWERLLAPVQARGVQMGMVFLDGTNVRAHQKAAGAAKRGDLRRSETIVRRLACSVAATAPGPA